MFHQVHKCETRGMYPHACVAPSQTTQSDKRSTSRHMSTDSAPSDLWLQSGLNITYLMQTYTYTYTDHFPDMIFLYFIRHHFPSLLFNTYFSQADIKTPPTIHINLHIQIIPPWRTYSSQIRGNRKMRGRHSRTPPQTDGTSSRIHGYSISPTLSPF